MIIEIKDGEIIVQAESWEPENLLDLLQEELDWETEECLTEDQSNRVLQK